jgi:hypothetical protein
MIHNCMTSMHKFRIWYQRGSAKMQPPRYQDCFGRDENNALRHFWQHYNAPAATKIVRVIDLGDVAGPMLDSPTIWTEGRLWNRGMGGAFSTQVPFSQH